MTAAGIASTREERDTEPPQDHERPAELIEGLDRRRSPEAALVPQLRSAIDRAEDRGDCADAAAADDVDLDAGFWIARIAPA